jgi:hypothetical protein
MMSGRQRIEGKEEGFTGAGIGLRHVEQAFELGNHRGGIRRRGRRWQDIGIAQS